MTKNKIWAQISPYWRLMRFDKPVGTLLLLWPTLWALYLANKGQPTAFVLFIFIAGVVVMRACGCVINDFADRGVDGQVKRSQQRPLVNGELSAKQALTTFFILALIAFGLVLQLNRSTVYWSLGAIAIASIYPFMKRYSYFPQVVLGAAFAWSIPMAYVAQDQALSETTWLLYVSTLLWVLAYDTLYGMVDRDDDMTIGVKSTAILFGDADLMIVSLIHSAALIGWILVASHERLNHYFWWGWSGAVLMVIYQMWIARTRQRDACFRAFRLNNLYGVSLTLGFIAARLSHPA
jgi:4-hydroxybenzoate polyprenyltransferase